MSALKRFLILASLAAAPARGAMALPIRGKPVLVIDVQFAIQTCILAN